MEAPLPLSFEDASVRQEAAACHKKLMKLAQEKGVLKQIIAAGRDDGDELDLGLD